MGTSRVRIVVLAVALVGALTAWYALAGAANDGLPSFRVNPQLRPDPAELAPAHGVRRPLGAVRDADDVIERFVADEIILDPSRGRSLAAFHARFGGWVLSDSRIPAPPKGIDRDCLRAIRPPPQLLLRVDTATMPISRLRQDAAAIGLAGPFELSSQDGLRFTAFLARATLEGFAVEPVLVGELTLQEHPIIGGYLDPSLCIGPAQNRFPYLCDGSPPRTGTANAWDHLALLGQPPSPVQVGVIDTGVTVNALGERAYGNLDLPSWTPGYNFQRDSYDLTDGWWPLLDGSTSPCIWPLLDPDPATVNKERGACWHGTLMTAVATAIADNRYGVAGVGQPNATPLLFQHDYGTTYSWGLALWTAVEWGADVVNMSVAHGCSRWSSRHCGQRCCGMLPSRRTITASPSWPAPGTARGTTIPST